MWGCIWHWQKEIEKKLIRFDSADDSVAQITLDYKNTTNERHLEVVSNKWKNAFLLENNFTEAGETVRNNSETGRLFIPSSL